MQSPILLKKTPQNGKRGGVKTSQISYSKENLFLFFAMFSSSLEPGKLEKNSPANFVRIWQFFGDRYHNHVLN